MPAQIKPVDDRANSRSVLTTADLGIQLTGGESPMVHRGESRTIIRHDGDAATGHGQQVARLSTAVRQQPQWQSQCNSVGPRSDVDGVRRLFEAASPTGTVVVAIPAVGKPSGSTGPE